MMECFRQEGACDSLRDELTIKCKIGIRLFTTFFSNHAGIASRKQVLLCHAKFYSSREQVLTSLFKIMALTDFSETGTKWVISIVGETLQSESAHLLLVFSKSC